MSEPTEPATAPGDCSYCGEWLQKGVVVAEIHSDAGAGHTVDSGTPRRACRPAEAGGGPAAYLDGLTV